MQRVGVALDVLAQRLPPAHLVVEDGLRALHLRPEAVDRDEGAPAPGVRVAHAAVLAAVRRGDVQGEALLVAVRLLLEALGEQRPLHLVGLREVLAVVVQHGPRVVVLLEIDPPRRGEPPRVGAPLRADDEVDQLVVRVLPVEGLDVQRLAVLVTEAERLLGRVPAALLQQQERPRAVLRTVLVAQRRVAALLAVDAAHAEFRHDGDHRLERELHRGLAVEARAVLERHEPKVEAADVRPLRRRPQVVASDAVLGERGVRRRRGVQQVRRRGAEHDVADLEEVGGEGGEGDDLDLAGVLLDLPARREHADRGEAAEVELPARHRVVVALVARDGDGRAAHARRQLLERGGGVDAVGEVGAPEEDNRRAVALVARHQLVDRLILQLRAVELVEEVVPQVLAVVPGGRRAAAARRLVLLAARGVAQHLVRLRHLAELFRGRLLLVGGHRVGV
mmetsp:Transcript_52818/g.162605  ORF Transcript_52818/g.162605 Transcript_52818/m.162605 type:complete len:450 (-) Transcript_52818:178-1527(-)